MINKRCMRFLIVVVIIFFVLSANSYGAVFNVTNPAEFQDALTTAENNGQDDTINVGAGTYNVTTTLSYTARENYALSIAGTGAVSTILDGGNAVQILDIQTIGYNLAHISISGITFQNGGNSSANGGGFGVVTGLANIVVQDSVFSNNKASYGGGAHIFTSSGAVTLTNNTFNGNSASGTGGGVHARSYSEAVITLTNNTFSGNSAGPDGGGAYATSGSGTVTLTNNTFSGNSASSGAGADAYSNSGAVTLTNNTFSGNSGSHGGGAHAMSDSGAVTLTNNIFNSNSASGLGGGAHARTYSGDITLTGNTFNSNPAGGDGGGAYAQSYIGGAITLTNNIFSGNSTFSGGVGAGTMAISDSGTVALINNMFSSNSGAPYGGGAYVHSSSNSVTLTNNTFSGNSASYGGGAYINPRNDTTANIYNNIFWSNTATMGNNDGDDLYVNSDGNGNGIGSAVNMFNNNLGINANLVTAMSEDLVVTNVGNYSQGSNIQTDCLLTTDLHLQAGSPCINAGNNSAPSLPTTDFEGEARIIHGVVDIGADEYSGPLCIPTQEICNNIDDDCDGLIDEGLPLNTYYRDFDSDTYGNPNNTTQTCSSTPPLGYVANNTDCNDADSTVNPGATEGPYGSSTCSDGKDNDCDTMVDANDPPCSANADLIVSVLTAPTGACAGQTITVSDTTKNNGTGSAGASTTKFYFSTDSTYSAGDTYLGSRAVPSLAAGAISAGSTNVTIPSITCADTYYIIAFADADNVVVETYTTTSEKNNSKSRSIKIGVDLIVSTLSAPTKAAAGSTIVITDTTKNQGWCPANSSTTRFYLSTDSILQPWDTSLGERTVPSLAEGTSSTAPTSVTIPIGTPPAIYYIIAVADANGVVLETNEANNTKYKSITITP